MLTALQYCIFVAGLKGDLKNQEAKDFTVI
jgi:hypothetical protein